MKKIPILGIDNAGKTSIIKTFQRQFEVISTLKPTKKIERIHLQVLGSDIIIWDFGGQKKYRDAYFENADINFSDVFVWFFIIDIQDQSSFSDVYEYFKVCKEAIAKYSPEAHLKIIIHKFDPALWEHKEKFLILAKNLEKNLLEMIKPLEAKLYYSSIFNPVSVFHAFSKALFGDTKLSQDLMDVFNDFIQKNDLIDVIDYLLVYTDDFVELGSYMRYGSNPTEYREDATFLFNLFKSEGLTILDAELFAEKGKRRHYIKKIDLETKKFYFVCQYKYELLDDEPDFRKKLKALQIIIQNLST
ncbi:MAG: ADP-ribosylation factor-like protein [Promethearchaeota archaeon]